MTITPEERQQWRAAESPYSLDKRITRLLDALEKAEDDVEAAQIGQIAAYKLAEDDAAEEIAQLKERAEKAEAALEDLEAWGCHLVDRITYGKMSKCYDVDMIVAEVEDSCTEATREEVAKVERERDELARFLDKNNDDCPFIIFRNGDVTNHYPFCNNCGDLQQGSTTGEPCWLLWAARAAAKEPAGEGK